MLEHKKIKKNYLGQANLMVSQILVLRFWNAPGASFIKQVYQISQVFFS